jgi:hypothetical protein
MNEIIVEGLQESDFLLLEEILKTYSVSINSSISFEDITNIHNKIKQIVDHIKS